MKRVTLFLSICMFLCSIGCNSDDDGLSNKEKQALNAAGVILADISQVFIAASDSDATLRAAAEESSRNGILNLSRNFYPGMENSTTPEIKEDTVAVADTYFNGKTPADLAGHTYTFTDYQGNACELKVDVVNTSSLYPVSYKISPNWTISVDYSFEQILTTGTSWDPVNVEGTVDFTARSPYYTRYFDGRIDSMTVNSIANGKTINPAVKLTIAALIPSDIISQRVSTDSDYYNFFYSKTDFTVADDKNGDNTPDGVQWGSGQRFYSEIKSGPTTVTEAVTKEFDTIEHGKQWDVFDLFKTALRECYVTDAKYTGADSIAETASIVETNDKILWDRVNINSQTVGKFTKTVTAADETPIVVDAYYASFNSIWVFDEYSYKTVHMEGTSKQMTGAIKVYRKYSTKPAAFPDLPLDDAARASLDITALNTYQIADPLTAFGVASPSASYAVSHGTTVDGEYDIETDSAISLFDSQYTTKIRYNKVKRTVNLNLNNNYLSITDASYSNGAVTGVVLIDGKEYEMKISASNGKGVVKANGKWVAL